MNIPADIAHKVVDNLRGAPFVLAILILNILVLAGFSLTLWQVGNAIERRDKILERCIR